MATIGVEGLVENRAGNAIQDLIAGTDIAARDFGGIASGTQAGDVAVAAQVDDRPPLFGIGVKHQIRQGSNRSPLAPMGQVRRPQVADNRYFQGLAEDRRIDQLDRKGRGVEDRLAMDANQVKTVAAAEFFQGPDVQAREVRGQPGDLAHGHGFLLSEGPQGLREFTQGKVFHRQKLSRHVQAGAGEAQQGDVQAVKAGAGHTTGDQSGRQRSLGLRGRARLGGGFRRGHARSRASAIARSWEQLAARPPGLQRASQEWRWASTRPCTSGANWRRR